MVCLKQNGGNHYSTLTPEKLNVVKHHITDQPAVAGNEYCEVNDPDNSTEKGVCVFCFVFEQELKHGDWIPGASPVPDIWHDGCPGRLYLFY